MVQAIREEINLRQSGDALPSVRDLMGRLKIGPGTVRSAFARLIAEGVIETRAGQGTFVSGPQKRVVSGDFAWQSVALGAARADTNLLSDLVKPPGSGVIMLSTGFLPPELQATRELEMAMTRSAVRPGVWDRLSLEGLEPLRSWFARTLGDGYSARDVLITPGSQSALGTVFRGLAAPGDALIVEVPTYVGAMAAARAAGLRLIPVATDSQGMIPELLADALQTSGARVVYSLPTFSNPSGTVLADSRRAEVLSLVTKARAFLVEDDWARDFAFGMPTPPAPLACADTNGHVVYIRSLSKSAAPSLRVGALCARGAALARLRLTRYADDFFVPGPMQEAALHLVSAPAWQRHLRRLHGELRARCDALVSAVHEHFGADTLQIIPRGGFHAWLRLPYGISDLEVAAEASRRNVLVSPGSGWFPGEPDAAYLRVTFAGMPEEAICEGVKVLAEVVADRAVD